MTKRMFPKTRSSESQSLPTGIFCGAHSQGLASISASNRGKSESCTSTQNYEQCQKQKMTLKLNEKLS